MGITKLADLVNALPRGDSLISKTLPDGLRYVDSANAYYVEPQLAEEVPVEAGQTSVVLIAAPGAVGKSTLAAEIANRTGSTLWDLSRLQVGSRTYLGTVMEAYGFEATGVQKRIRQGEFLFVLDALDEAQVRAGSQNFDAFVEDLVQLHLEPRPGPTLVLLARVDTADWIHLIFDEKGVPFARMTIEYFDRASAENFIETRLDRHRMEDGDAPVHRQQIQPFSRARTRLFEIIYSLFQVDPIIAWSDPRVQSFLGYAPVLEALAEFIDVDNFISFLQELEDGAGRIGDPWQFLGNVVGRLLVREKNKMQPAIQANLSASAARAGWRDWPSLYGEEEQCSRVLAKHLAISASPRIEVPAAIATDYERALETILPQHPFLAGRDFANVVFKEYIYAWALLREGSATTTTLRAFLHSTERPFLPSQIFGHFIIQIASPDDAILDGQDFGAFYESCLARGGVSPLSVVSADDGAHATIKIDDEDELAVEIVDTGRGMSFWRRLSNAVIEVELNVRLGLPGQRFLLGPSVFIECGQLAVASQEVDIDLMEDVNMVADRFLAEAPPIRLRFRNKEDGLGELGVSWLDLSHPWAHYRKEFPVPSALLSESLRGEVLRRFLMMFRRQRTRKERTVLMARWSPEQLEERDNLIKVALHSGVISKVEGRSAIEFNSDFDSLKSLVGEPGSLSPEAVEFLVGYLGREQARRFLANSS